MNKEDERENIHLYEKDNFSSRGSYPYKGRNIGIGFIIGGVIIFVAGAYYLDSVEEDFDTKMIGGVAMAIGTFFLIGGTIATIIGSVHGHKYAGNKLQIRLNGSSIGIDYKL